MEETQHSFTERGELGPKGKAVESVGRGGAVRSGGKALPFIRSRPPLEGDVGCSGIYVNNKEASQGFKEVNILRSVFRTLSLAQM